MSPHYLVKCTNFSFFHAYWVPIRDTDELQKRCDTGWILAERGERCSWSVAKKTESMYLCRRWSVWTLTVTLLAWHSLCHISQPVLFRATNANPQPAFCRSTNIWRNATYLQSDEKVVIFDRVIWKIKRWTFLEHSVYNQYVTSLATQLWINYFVLRVLQLVRRTTCTCLKEDATKEDGSDKKERR